MYPHYNHLNVPTWIIGPALGEGPLIDRPGRGAESVAGAGADPTVATCAIQFAPGSVCYEALSLTLLLFLANTLAALLGKGDSDKAMEVQSNENAALLKLLKTKSRTKTELLKVSRARRRARQAALDALLAEGKVIRIDRKYFANESERLGRPVDRRRGGSP